MKLRDLREGGSFFLFSFCGIWKIIYSTWRFKVSKKHKPTRNFHLRRKLPSLRLVYTPTHALQLLGIESKAVRLIGVLWPRVRVIAPRWNFLNRGSKTVTPPNWNESKGIVGKHPRSVLPEVIYDPRWKMEEEGCSDWSQISLPCRERGDSRFKSG